jgi:hypothetical protein
MALNVGQLIQERDGLVEQLKNMGKTKARISLLNKLIALEDPLAAPPSTVLNGHNRRAAGEFLCDQCDAPGFASESGVRMHKHRVHKGTIKTPNQQAKGKK